MPFDPAGAITGIGSLPFTSMASAIRSVAKFSAEIPFWPQLPQLSERESIIGQGLGILSDMIERRNDGYGYQVKEGQIDLVVETLCRPTCFIGAGPSFAIPHSSQSSHFMSRRSSAGRSTASNPPGSQC